MAFNKGDAVEPGDLAERVGGDLVMDGAYPELFTGYIAYKRAAGYAMARSWQYPVRELSRFLASKPPAPEVLTADYVNEFCGRRGGEAASTQDHRMSVCRQFALYLQTLGYGCYVRPNQLTLRGTAFVPRIITEEEMARVIAAADAMPPKPNAPTAHRVFPVLVRILWSCGLRLGEALSLTVGDVNVADGVLLIRNAKGGKSRVVPVSDSLRACLERCWRDMGFPAASPDTWIFPSRRRARFGDIPDVCHAFEIVSNRRDFPELVMLLRQIRAYRGNGISADLFYEGAVAEAIALIIARAAEIEILGSESNVAHISAEDRRVIEMLPAYIEQHLSEKLPTAALAHKSCMGLTKFKQCFHAVYGTSPGDYVAGKRFDRALDLLESTSHTVAQVGAAVGYSKPSAFNDAFRRRLGCTPNEFRRRKGESSVRHA